MPTLTIGDKRVTVGDEFLQLSPEQQNATVEEIAKSLGVSGKAKPTQADTQLHPTQDPNAPWYKKLGGAADDIARIAGDTLSFGLADRLAGYTGGEGVDAERAKTQAARERAGWAGTVSELGAGVGAVSGLAKAGLTTARALPQGMTGVKGVLGRTAAQSADGAILGAASAAGRGEDVETGALIGGALGVGGGIAGEGLSAAAGKVGAMFNKPKPAPSSEVVRSEASALYRKADDAGVIVAPRVMSKLADDVKTELADFGYHPDLQPKVSVLLRELDRLSGQPVTAKGVDTFRKIAGSVSKSMDDSERALAGMVTRKVDDAMANLGEADVIMGNAKVASNSFAQAREMWKRQAKLQTIEGAMERAQNNAGASGSGGNIDNAIRQQFRSILNNKSQRRLFSGDELTAMESVVRGKPGQNVTRLIGKLSPEGNGLMAAIQGGGMVATGGLSIPAAVAGAIAKRISEGATKSSVDELARVVAAGGSRAAATPAPNALQQLAQSKRDALSRGITAGSLSMVPWGN